MRLVLFTAFLMMTVTVSAPQAEEPEAVFGQALMTSAEVADYKNRLAACKTAQERTQVQTEHKDRMIQRARWKGMVIHPDAMTMAGND